MGETHEVPHHNLADFEPHLGYATEGQAFCGVPMPNILGGSQYHPQPEPLPFVVGRLPLAIVEREKFNHIKERLRAIEGDRDHGFANMAELCLVPDVIIPSKFKMSNVTPSTPHIYINKGIKIQILIKSIFKTFLNTSFSNG